LPAYAALFTLLAARAAETPLLALVDDAQALDVASGRGAGVCRRAHRCVGHRLIAPRARTGRPARAGFYAGISAIQLTALDREAAAGRVAGKTVAVRRYARGRGRFAPS
jgi:hypothetical protein